MVMKQRSQLCSCLEENTRGPGDSECRGPGAGAYGCVHVRAARPVAGDEVKEVMGTPTLGPYWLLQGSWFLLLSEKTVKGLEQRNE